MTQKHTEFTFCCCCCCCVLLTFLSVSVVPLPPPSSSPSPSPSSSSSSSEDDGSSSSRAGTWDKQRRKWWKNDKNTSVSADVLSGGGAYLCGPIRNQQTVNIIIIKLFWGEQTHWELLCKEPYHWELPLPGSIQGTILQGTILLGTILQETFLQGTSLQGTIH